MIMTLIKDSISIFLCAYMMLQFVVLYIVKLLLYLCERSFDVFLLTYAIFQSRILYKLFFGERYSMLASPWSHNEEVEKYDLFIYVSIICQISSTLMLIFINPHNNHPNKITNGYYVYLYLGLFELCNLVSVIILLMGLEIHGSSHFHKFTYKAIFSHLPILVLYAVKNFSSLSLFVVHIIAFCVITFCFLAMGFY